MGNLMMHFLLLTFLFLLQQSQSIEVCYTKGECLNSPYVDLPHRDSAKGCHDECLANDQCSAFTWYSSTNLCLGFIECINFSNSTCSDCVSGLKNCQEPVCFETGRCDGDLQDVQHVEDENECLHLCQSFPSCNWFTFDEEFYECFLLNGCSNLNSSCISCQSGQINCQEKPEPSKLMVIGGYKNYSDNIEVVDLSKLGSLCSDPPQLGKSVLQVAAFMSQGMVHICGGGYGIGRSCFFLDHKNSEWFETTPMIESRGSFQVIKIGFEKFWMLGGGSDPAPTDTTEILHKGKFYRGPLMPIKLNRFCAVRINSTLGFIGGGRSLKINSNETFFSNASYLVNLKSMEWIELPSMMGERYVPACGLFKDDNHNDFIVRAGGYSSEGSRKDSEILDLETLTWSPGPDLPYPLSSANLGVAQFKDHFIITGGYSFEEGTVFKGNLLKFDKSLQWHTLTQTILPRSEHTVIPVPDEIVECILKEK